MRSLLFWGCDKLLMNNVLMMSAAIWELIGMDRERGMCLPVAGMVSCPTPLQGSRGMWVWTEQKLASVTCQDCPCFLAGYESSCSSCVVRRNSIWWSSSLFMSNELKINVSSWQVWVFNLLFSFEASRKDLQGILAIIKFLLKAF